MPFFVAVMQLSNQLPSLENKTDPFCESSLMKTPVAISLLIGWIACGPLPGVAPPAAWAVLIVAGSPEYDQTTQIGFQNDSIPVVPGQGVNSSGTAVGYSQKYVSGSNLGRRAVRWDGSGTAATELDNLGVDGSGFTNAYATCRQRGGDRRGILHKVRQRQLTWASRGAVGRQWHRRHGTGESRRERLGHYQHLRLCRQRGGDRRGMIPKVRQRQLPGRARCGGTAVAPPPRNWGISA